MIKIINEINEIDHDKITVFANCDYLKYVSNNYGWFASDKFLLPFYISKKFIFKRLFFTASTIYLNEFSKEDEKFFLNDVIDLSKKINIDIIDIPSVNALFNVYPDKSEYIQFGSYILDLSKSEEILFNELHPKHRNVIRKAEKDNVVIKESNDLSDFCYEIIKNTYKRQSKNFLSKDNFIKLKNYLKDKIKFYAAFKDEVLQGCAVLLWTQNQSCYYLYGGSIDNPYTGAINLLHWKAILDMKKLNVRYYDFFGARLNPEPGSKLEGIQRFKSRFGGELKIGYLWKIVLNPYKYILFKIIFKLYCIVKNIKYEGDIIDQEKKRIKKNINNI